MRGAFVVQLGRETKPAEGHFEGWIEEVDSGTELRFRSGEELLKFLGRRFELVLASADSARVPARNQEATVCKAIPQRKADRSKKKKQTAGAEV
jgi:hypothetical protein